MRQPPSRTSPADVSRETNIKLREFADLLAKWNRAINLISHASASEIWRRHILDSMQLLDLLPEKTARIADLGSGGGLPGMVIAIILSDSDRHISVTLIESNQRKAAFLRNARHNLGIDVDIIAERIENAQPVMADVVTARALAPLPRLLSLAVPHLAPGGMCLFHKGKKYGRELTESLDTWRFQSKNYFSMSDPQGVILRIEEIERV